MYGRYNELCYYGYVNLKIKIMSKTVTIDISKQLLAWAIDEAERNDVDLGTIDKMKTWLNDDFKPSFRQISDVSKKTNIPFGYFLLDNAPSESYQTAEFRTLGSRPNYKPSRNLIDTINSMLSIQEWARSDYLENGYGKRDFVGSVSDCDDYQTVASRILDELSLEPDWCCKCSDNKKAFSKVRSRAESVGIIVIVSGVVGSNTRRVLSVDEFRGVTLIDDVAPLIFINGADTYNGRLFSLVHELSHVWIGVSDLYDDECFNNYNKQEQLCNAVAAELIVPREFFMEEWNQISRGCSVKEAIEKISNLFNCSRLVVARRALDCGLVSKDVYEMISSSVANEYRNLKKYNKKGGNYYSNLSFRFGNNFIHSLSQSIQNGRTTYTEAYSLTGTNRKTFDGLLRSINA